LGLFSFLAAEGMSSAKGLLIVFAVLVVFAAVGVTRSRRRREAPPDQKPE
jgi:membrane protein implicated in regulation of membrane protease activity